MDKTMPQEEVDDAVGSDSYDEEEGDDSDDVPFHVPGKYTWDGYDEAEMFGDNCERETVSCNICGRKIIATILEKHTFNCQKKQQRKNQMDQKKQIARLLSRDQREFMERVRQRQVRVKNWRRKHEDFVQAVENMRQCYRAKLLGKPLLPMPAPSAIPEDFKKCTTCGRHFNPHSYQKHFERCRDEAKRKLREDSAWKSHVDKLKQMNPGLSEVDTASLSSCPTPTPSLASRNSAVASRSSVNASALSGRKSTSISTTTSTMKTATAKSSPRPKKGNGTTAPKKTKKKTDSCMDVIRLPVSKLEYQERERQKLREKREAEAKAKSNNDPQVKANKIKQVSELLGLDQNDILQLLAAKQNQNLATNPGMSGGNMYAMQGAWHGSPTVPNYPHYQQQQYQQQQQQQSFGSVPGMDPMGMQNNYYAGAQFPPTGYAMPFQAPVCPPVAAAAPPEATTYTQMQHQQPTDGGGEANGGVPLKKFCTDCGWKFPNASTKFCCGCGSKRC